MSIDDLLEAVEGPAPKAPTAPLDELIQRERDREREQVDIEILVGDRIATVRFSEIAASDWLDIAAASPPRADVDGDQLMGFNPIAVGRSYPVTGIDIDGEQPTQDQWARLTAALSAPDLTDVAAAVWGVNIQRANHRRAAARAARARRSSAPPAGKEGDLDD